MILVERAAGRDMKATKATTGLSGTE